MERPYSEEKKSTSIKFCVGQCGHEFDVDEWRFIFESKEELCEECFNDMGFDVVLTEEDIEAEA